MISILFLGLLIGMQHAFEADHVAAVASLAARNRSFRGILRDGIVWGLGHSLALLGFAGAVILLDLSAGERLAGWLELAVGVMLVLLGGQVLFRLWRDRVHFHMHRHAGGEAHLHAHSHAGEPRREGAAHGQAPHDHRHPKGLPLRALFVGVMHGMAGSAALVILAASAIGSPALGLGYVALFGLGSIIGMALLSAAIAVPLTYTAKALTWVNRGLQGAVGAATIGLGLVILNDVGGQLGVLP
jgi:ABC-type nickel/cobalt efflux system permease component RcnA